MIARIALRDETLAAPTWGKHRRSACLGLIPALTGPSEPHRAGQPPPRRSGQTRPGYQQNIRRLTTRKVLDAVRGCGGGIQVPTPGSPRTHPDTARSGPPHPRSHHPDRRLGHPERSQPAPNLRVGTLVAPATLTEVGNPRRYSTKVKFAIANNSATRSQLRKSGKAPTEPGRKPPPQPDRPPQCRGPTLLTRTHRTREDPAGVMP